MREERVYCPDQYRVIYDDGEQLFSIDNEYQNGQMVLFTSSLAKPWSKWKPALSQEHIDRIKGLILDAELYEGIPVKFR